jgi:Ca-activated chloride channel homolog
VHAFVVLTFPYRISDPGRPIFTMKFYVCSLSLLLVFAVLGQAQQPPPPPSPTNPGTKDRQTEQRSEEIGDGEVIRIKANLVSVPVSVIDRQGKYIVDLNQQDFRLYEDGVEQAIVHFSNVDQSLSVVLLMDTSGSTAAFLDQIKAAAKSFVEQLRPSDAIQPVYFHGDIKPLTPSTTNDPQILSAAIDRMPSGPLNMGTRLYDAVDFALDSLRPASSRKAIILITDGENTWGRATMKNTLKEAEESDIIIYTLQYGTDPLQKYLQELAEKTGGRYFKTPDTNMIRQSFAEVAEELRRQYVIGYYPMQAQTVQERKIKVRVDRDHILIRARRSYTYNP